MSRYSIYPVHGEFNKAYKLDRFTGKVTLLIGHRESNVTKSPNPVERKSIYHDFLGEEKK